MANLVMHVLGVLADTHVPDRARGLNPRVKTIFRENGVEAILHAGDICVPGVIQQLEQIAPVYAVRGNRDWVRLGSLPRTRLLTFGLIQVALAHGHGGLLAYAFDKTRYLLYGLNPEHYWRRLVTRFPQAGVIIFGHIHLRINTWVDGVLLFNPGSACCPHEKDRTPSVGILRIQVGGAIESEIIDLI